MQTVQIERPSAVELQALVGQVRRFGQAGVLYEVQAIVSPELASILVLDTGEITDYRLDRLLNDPED